MPVFVRALPMPQVETLTKAGTESADSVRQGFANCTDTFPATTTHAAPWQFSGGQIARRVWRQICALVTPTVVHLFASADFARTVYAQPAPRLMIFCT